MSLSRLQISRIRNLQQVQLQGLRKVNVVYGRNGSGKTSLLEAIHLLGMARSFRGNNIRSLISHGDSDCVVFGLSETAGSAPVSLGVRRNMSGEVQIKVNGMPVRSAAELVTYLPLQVVNADSFDLLTGAPGARRRYLDWGVFHVEHRFLAQWQRFQRCIKQRNKLLRRGKIQDRELEVWTRDLASAGTALGEYRRAYFAMLVPRFKEIMSRLAPSLLPGLELRYQQGWDRQLAYREALESGVDTDIEQGFTHSGPQRADIRVMVNGRLAADTLSRGQQKLVVCSLKLAQGQLMSEQGRGQCIYLVDDLPSELDDLHSRAVCEVLAAMDAQVFITCVEQADVVSVWPEEDRHQIIVFHVEHGEVQTADRVGG